MIRYIVFLLFSLNAAINSSAQQNTPISRTGVQETVKGFFDGLAHLDVGKTKSFCTSDITILESGKVWNFDSLAVIITNIQAHSKDFKRINKFEFLETKVSGNIAWVSYINQATITFDNKKMDIKWLESAVMKKEKGRWKISLLHSTETERTN